MLAVPGSGEADVGWYVCWIFPWSILTSLQILGKPEAVKLTKGRHVVILTLLVCILRSTSIEELFLHRRMLCIMLHAGVCR